MKQHHERRIALGTILSTFILLAGSIHASVYQGNNIRPWGLKQPLVVSKSSSQNSENLHAFLQQLRCGDSSYQGSDDYYGNDSNRGNYGDPSGYYSDENRKRNGYYDNYRDDYRDSYSGGKDDDDYDDRGRSSRSVRGSSTGPLSTLQSKLKNGDRRIGVPLLGFGVVFTMLGISFFFNKALMRLGNLMLIAGVPTTIGPSRTAGYFFQPKKTRATATLCVGIFLVFVGWPISGIALEVFGLMNLFGNMFPMFWAIFKNMPFVSSIMNSAKQNGSSSRGRSSSYDRRYDRDPYYDDRQGYAGEYGDDEDPYY